MQQMFPDWTRTRDAAVRDWHLKPPSFPKKGFVDERYKKVALVMKLR